MSIGIPRTPFIWHSLHILGPPGAHSGPSTGPHQSGTLQKLHGGMPQRAVLPSTPSRATRSKKAQLEIHTLADAPSAAVCVSNFKHTASLFMAPAHLALDCRRMPRTITRSLGGVTRAICMLPPCTARAPSVCCPNHSSSANDLSMPMYIPTRLPV